MSKIDKITLPGTQWVTDLLRGKLEEYRARLFRNRLVAPEIQMDTICKIAIVEKLLIDGCVESHLAWDLNEKYGSGFSRREFDVAMRVIADYVTTGGVNTTQAPSCAA